MNIILEQWNKHIYTPINLLDNIVMGTSSNNYWKWDDRRSWTSRLTDSFIFMYMDFSFVLLFIFPWRLYVNYSLTVTAGGGRGWGCMFKRSMTQVFPHPMLSPKKEGARNALIVYMMFIAGFSIPNILRTMANNNRARLDTHQTFTIWTPKLLSSNV